MGSLDGKFGLELDKDNPPPRDGPGSGQEEQATADEAKPTGDYYAALSLPLWREIPFIIVICLAMFTTQVGLGQVLLLLPTIGRAFDISNPGDLSWLVAGYSLTVGTFILVSGRLGDIYGYKRMLVIGYTWYALWSLVCGLSVYNKQNGYVMFVFARVLSGIGPAMTVPNGLAIFGSAYPDGMRKDMAFALFGACAPSGAVVGGTLAAVFDLTWWPWTFFSFAIVLALLAVLCIFVIPSMGSVRTPPKTWREVTQTLDLLGGATGITSLVLINFAWNQAGVVGWTQQRDYVYISLLLGVILLPCFFVIELKVAKEPLIPFSALTSDVYFVLACIACGWGSFGIWLFYLLQIYSDLRHGSPLLIAAWLSPVAVSGFSASVATGIILSKVRSSLVMVLSMSFFTVGVILVATVPVNQVYWIQTFICSLIIPWGMDMSFPAGTIIMSNSISKEHQGMAASLINTVVNYSISLGLGVAATVEVNVNKGGKTEHERLLGYRGALYLAIGLAGSGLLVSIAFALKQAIKDPREKRRSQSSRLSDM
ncbi:major facilitator superfamily-domain-containing protein [Ustulina deusta]|nr:major facilitator superfamily-domain-containing protein [Ustulina deusta]KAI3342051.1 major facilitator superfamily-domain-containing protein [Ustulina deusta]